MPGMRLRSLRAYLRIVGRNTDGSFRLSWDDPDRPVEGDSYAAEDLAKATPDLADPATLGCLLALVSTAYDLSLEDVYCVRLTGGWGIPGVARAEAMIAALEAAE